jgi:hypothetical protein
MTKGNYQWTLDHQSELPQRHSRWPLAIGLILVIGLAVVVIVGTFEFGPPERTSGTGSRRLVFYNKSQAANTPHNTPHINVWWDDIPAHLQAATDQPDNTSSNIHPGDYAGPEACRECHQETSLDERAGRCVDRCR